MAMDGHDHRPGLGVGLSPSTQEPFTRFLEEPLDAGPLTLDCLAEPGIFFFRRETGHAPPLVPNQETKTRTFIIRKYKQTSTSSRETPI